VGNVFAWMWNLREMFPTELPSFPFVHLSLPADLLLVLLKSCNVFSCHKFPSSEVIQLIYHHHMKLYNSYIINSYIMYHQLYISVSCKAFVGVFFLFLATVCVYLTAFIPFPLVSGKFCSENLDK